jgi:hypothetical protein
MAYDAFISYSHSADGRLAPAVQTALQRLARRWYAVRALRVFRDQGSLAVNPHLWASIAAAMSESAWFVLLTSPDAAASPWVNREIEHWCAHNDPEHVLIVLTDGTLAWDNSQGDFDPAVSDALPPALMGRFTNEPLFLDLRWARDDTDLDLRNSRFRQAIAELAAPMHGMDREDLESEDVRRHRRALRVAGVVALAFVVALLVAALTTQNAVASDARAAKEKTLRLEETRLRKSLASQVEITKTQATRANLNASDAARQTELARLESTRADRSASEARANAIVAQRNAASSKQSRDIAELRRRDAEAQKRAADDNLARAEAAQLNADAARSAATAAFQEAIAQRSSAELANAQVAEVNSKLAAANEEILSTKLQAEAQTKACQAQLAAAISPTTSTSSTTSTTTIGQ